MSPLRQRSVPPVIKCSKCGGSGLGPKELTGATDFHTPLCSRCGGSGTMPNPKAIQK